VSVDAGFIDGVYAELSGATAVRFTAAYKQFGLKGKIPLLGITQLTDYSSLPSEDPAAITGASGKVGGAPRSRRATSQARSRALPSMTQ